MKKLMVGAGEDSCGFAATPEADAEMASRES